MIRIDRVDEGFYYYVSDGVPKRVSKDEVAFLQRGGNVMTAIEQLDASIGPYEAEPVEMPPLEEPDAEKLPSAQWHTHREIGDIQDRLSEWNGRLKKEFAVEGHGHSEFARINSALYKVQVEVSDAQSGITQLQMDLHRHDHPVPNHPHEWLENEIKSLRNDFGALMERAVGEHEHGDLATREQMLSLQRELDNRLASIRELMQKQADYLRSLIPVVPAQKPSMSEAEVRALIKQTESERLSKANAVLLSTQEVGGKKRYILEEL